MTSMGESAWRNECKDLKKVCKKIRGLDVHP